MVRSRALGDGTFDGVLVVDKPVGPTSHDLVDLVRRLTGVRRVGHGGTLDPFAGGVLPVFIGRATRLVEYHMADDKAYRAMIAFGATSTTDDLDGEQTAGEGPVPTRQRLEVGLIPFRGPIRQVPPDHSAVRVQGRRAYELARGGERPVLVARDVVVHRLDLVAWDESDPTRPTATVEISCSAGTYIRAIARDLGASLGCGAYLVALTRSQSGPFTREQAHVPDAIKAAFAAGRGTSLLLPADSGLDAFPSVSLGGDDLQALLRGQVVRAPTDGPGNGATALRRGHCRVRDATGRLAAIARLEGGRLHPEKVLLEPDPRS
jgi:tRNA pseudouridine55 synthase